MSEWLSECGNEEQVSSRMTRMIHVANLSSLARSVLFQDGLLSRNARRNCQGEHGKGCFFAGLEVRMRVKVRVAIFFFPSRGGECKT